MKEEQCGIGGGGKVCVAMEVQVAVVQAEHDAESDSSRRTTVASGRSFLMLDDDSARARRSVARRRVFVAGMDSAGISDIEFDAKLGSSDDDDHRGDNRDEEHDGRHK